MQFIVPVFRLSLCAFIAATVLAQQPASDPTTEPRKVKTEMNRAFKDWLEKDVGPIITEAEKRVFLSLKTDEEREKFIQIFWDNRDPNPDTEENEYREEYYERVAYANANFTSGIPGWKTDRGRIYIKWGKPDSVESRPSGGAYDRPAYHGGGSTTTYPFETWFYRHLDGVGDGIEIEFVDTTGTGEYRMARSPEDKSVLINVPSGRDPNDSNRDRYLRDQDTPFGRLAIIRGLEGEVPTDLRRIFNLSRSGTGVLDNNALFFDVRIDHFRRSEDQVVVTITVQTNNRQLKFEPVGGIETARLNLFGTVTAVTGKRSGSFEDAITTTATTEELVNLRNRASIYQRAIALPPGNYKVDIAVRDILTGNAGRQSIGFAVPRYDDKKLSSSTLILASKLRPTDPQDVGGRFVIGSAKVIPNVSGIFKRGQEVGIYLQVYNAGIDQTTLRPAVDVEYLLVKDGKEVLRQPEDWSGLSDSGQRLTVARLLPTDGLPLGEYEVRVVMKDKVSGQVIENTSKFSLED